MENYRLKSLKKAFFYYLGVALALLSLVPFYISINTLLNNAADLDAAGWDKKLLNQDAGPLVLVLHCLSFECPREVSNYLFHAKFLNVYGWFYLGLAILTTSLFVSLYAKLIRDTRDPGKAHWATPDEIKDLVGKPGYLGIAHDRIIGYPNDSLFAHTLVIGRPGSGKTASVLEPSVVKALMDGHSVIVLEQKHPNVNGYPKYFPWIEEHTDANIQVFVPTDPNSYTFPLLYGADDPNHARDLAYLFYPILDDKDPAKFHYEQERPILATILNLVAAHERGSMEKAYEIFSRGATHVFEYLLDAKRQSWLTDAQLSSLNSFFDLPAYKKAEAISGITGKLAPFANDVIAKNFSFSDKQIDFTAVTRKQGFLYIAVNQEILTLGPGQAVLGMIKLALDKWLVTEAARNAGSLPNPVLIFFDEFPNLGPLPNVVPMLQTMRERRVGYFLATQTLASLTDVYGPNTAKAIVSTMGHVILTAKTAAPDILEISEYIGKTTDRKRSRARSGEIVTSPFEVVRTEREELTGDYLLRPDEFADLPLGQAVVVGSNKQPILVEVPLLDNKSNPRVGRHPEFNKLFGEVRKSLPNHPRTTETFKLLIAPYVRDPEVEKFLTQVGVAPSALRDRQPGGEPAAPPPPSPTPAPPPQKHRPSPNLEQPTKDESIEELNRWLVDLDDYLPLTHQKVDPKKHQVSFVYLTKRPGTEFPYPDEAELSSWKNHGLVSVEQPYDLTITSRALRGLSEGTDRLIKKWAILTRVLEWLEESGERVVGHPKYKNGTSPVAVIDAGRLIVSRTVFADEVFYGPKPPKETLELIGIDPNADSRNKHLGRKRTYVIPFPEGVLPFAENGANGEEDE